MISDEVMLKLINSSHIEDRHLAANLLLQRGKPAIGEFFIKYGRYTGTPKLTKYTIPCTRIEIDGGDTNRDGKWYHHNGAYVFAAGKAFMFTTNYGEIIYNDLIEEL